MSEYSPEEAVVEGQKAVWDAVKAKTKVFVTRNLQKDLPKIKGGGTYTNDPKYPVAGVNQSAGGDFKRWVLVEK